MCEIVRRVEPEKKVRDKTMKMKIRLFFFFGVKALDNKQKGR